MGENAGQSKLKYNARRFRCSVEYEQQVVLLVEDEQ
jgi:hypothetical protein